MKSIILGVSDDCLVASSSSLTSGSASDSSVCVSSACSAFSCFSHRFLLASRMSIIRVESVLLRNLCHSENNGVTTNLKKPVKDNNTKAGI